MVPSLPRPSRVASPKLLGVRAKLSASEPATDGEGMSRRCRDKQHCSRMLGQAVCCVRNRSGKRSTTG